MLGHALALGIGTFAAGEAITAFGVRRWNRRAAFRAAAETAARLRRPLMVVGDPSTGFVTRFFGRDYGCGDVCTDLTGCPTCPAGIAGPLEEVLPRLPSASHVVFESCTLEYVTDLPKVVRELGRVAVPGGIFQVRVEPRSSTFWLYPGARWEYGADGVWRSRR